MSEEIGKGEEKVSLLVFLEANHKILSVLGVFIALSVFTKNYLEGYFAIIASFNFLTIVILIWLEFLGRFPSKASSTTISLGLFEALFSYTVIIFFIVWFIDLNEFIPKAYKAITFILILVFMTVMLSSLIKRFDVFDRLFDRKLGERRRQRFLLYFLVLLMTFYFSLNVWNIIEAPLDEIFASILSTANEGIRGK